ncbi:MAG: hypothetical protein H7061_02250 [Bdellovibrionaceae bacterium]|nr:hypothetical protein [Bdellovibrio sp.]
MSKVLKCANIGIDAFVNVHLRTASSNDLPLIIEMENELWPEGQRCSEENFLKRIATYNAGFILAFDNYGKLVGTFYCVKRNFTPKRGKYTWYSESGDGAGSTHLNGGNALFGISVTVRPVAPKGTLRMLFNGWRSLAKEESLSYIFGGSRIPGLSTFSGNPEEYLSLVKGRKLFDPVLSKYMSCDMKVGNLIPQYFRDSESCDFGVEVYDLIIF